MTWPLSAFLPSLSLDFVAAVRQAAELGFRHVDVAGQADRPGEHLEALADTGVIVSGAALAGVLPARYPVEALDPATRRAALRRLEREVADAARLGATCAYVVDGPMSHPTARAYFAEGCALLADYAAGRMVRLAVGHAGEVQHANLGRLLDLPFGLGGRDPAEAIRAEGSRLFRVRLRGFVAESAEYAGPVLTALNEAGYTGELTLGATQHDGPGSLARARDTIRRLSG
jgi:hypothetical protein